MLLITEIFCHCKSCLSNTHTCSRWLIHLSEHQGCFSRTPDSFISVQRSFPSRERSPTPVNMEYPPCSVAILLDQLLDQNCFTYTGTTEQTDLTTLCIRARRSMTLIPVSRISTAGLCSSNVGGSLWIPTFLLLQASPPSIVSPSTLNRRPSVFLSYRNLDTASCSCYFHISVKSFTGCQHNTAYYIISDMLCNFHNTFFATIFNFKASLIAGRFSSSNSTSTTGPITCTIFPFSS